MEEDAELAEKINELLGAVAALKAYIAHLPGAADVDLEAVRRAGRDTGAGLIGGVHPSTHVNDAVDDIQRMASMRLVPLPLGPRRGDLSRRRQASLRGRPGRRHRCVGRSASAFSHRRNSGIARAMGMRRPQLLKM